PYGPHPMTVGQFRVGVMGEGRPCRHYCGNSEVADAAIAAASLAARAASSASRARSSSAAVAAATMTACAAAAPPIPVIEPSSSGLLAATSPAERHPP